MCLSLTPPRPHGLACRVDGKIFGTYRAGEDFLYLPGRDGRWVGGARGGLEMEATVFKPDLAISLRRE
jgi:hypothetical protein